MPNPIDHRDVSLSSPGAETTRIDIHFDTVGVAHGARNHFADLGSKQHEESKHELLVLDAAGKPIATFYWHRLAGSAGPGADCKLELDDRDPKSSGSPTLPTSQPQQTWISQLAPKASWTFLLEVWSKGESGYTAAVGVATAVPGGVEFKLDVTRSATGTNVYNGLLTARES
jgi:hypothetical protein